VLMAMLSCLACGNEQQSKVPAKEVEESPSPQDQAKQIADRQLSEKEKQAFIDGEVDYTVIAQDFCECAQEAIKVHNETEGPMKEHAQDREIFREYSTRRAESQEAAVKCCIEVKGKRTAAKLDKKTLTDQLKVECAKMQMPIIIQILLKAVH
ncbi:MAG: hypothetical protein AAF985_10750, partial [Bacteroidota bacterium]